MPYICDGCGRRGAPSAKEDWYQGTSGEAMDDAEVIDIVYLCPECFQRLDQEEKPRWRLWKPATASRQAHLEASDG